MEYIGEYHRTMLPFLQGAYWCAVVLIVLIAPGVLIDFSLSGLCNLLLMIFLFLWSGRRKKLLKELNREYERLVQTGRPVMARVVGSEGNMPGNSSPGYNGWFRFVCEWTDPDSGELVPMRSAYQWRKPTDEMVGQDVPAYVKKEDGRWLCYVDLRDPKKGSRKKRKNQEKERTC